MDNYNSKQIYSDQFNIPWNILDKRALMITEFSNFTTKMTEDKFYNKTSKKIIISCITYLYNELKSLKNSKVVEIKDNDEDNIISFKKAREIYNGHIGIGKKAWDFQDMEQMYNFCLEACRICGIADPGFVKRDYTKINALRGVQDD
jgi:hypothetical protein